MISTHWSARRNQSKKSVCVGFKRVTSRDPEEDGEVGLENNHYRALTADVSQWKRCSLLTMIWFQRRKNVGIVRCCPLIPTAFRRSRGI